MENLFLVAALAVMIILAVALKAVAGRKDEGKNGCTGHSCGACNEAGECGLAQIMASHKGMKACEDDYFDDEELDRFRGRDATGYDAAEVAEFAEVMRTMRREEVAGWVEGLHHRGVELPAVMRPEAEERAGHALFSRARQ